MAASSTPSTLCELAPSVVLQAIRHIKPRLFVHGGVANPRNSGTSSMTLRRLVKVGPCRTTALSFRIPRTHDRTQSPPRHPCHCPAAGLLPVLGPSAGADQGHDP